MTSEKLPNKLERVLTIAMWFALMFGIAVNSVLAFKHISGKNLPGCQLSGADCDVILTSPYGRILGISITVFAFGYFAVIAVALLIVPRFQSGPSSALFALSLPILSTVGLVTAMWSVNVMLSKFNQICLWCLMLHIANSLFFMMAVVFALHRYRRFSVEANEKDAEPLGCKPVIAAAIAAAFLGVWQVVVLSRFHDTTELEVVAVEAIANPLTVLSFGKNDVIQTVKGDKGAPHRIVVYACFTCGYCRETHQHLTKLQAQYPGKLRIDTRLCPLSGRCNDYMSVEEKPEHQYACELAMISLAVALANPNAFGPFADFLYDKQSDMTEAMAAEKARELVGDEQLDEVLKSPALQRRLREDVQLAKQIQLKNLPGVYVRRGIVSGMKNGQPVSPTFTVENLERLLSVEFAIGK